VIDRLPFSSSRVDVRLLTTCSIPLNPHKPSHPIRISVSACLRQHVSPSVRVSVSACLRQRRSPSAHLSQHVLVAPSVFFALCSPHEYHGGTNSISSTTPSSTLLSFPFYYLISALPRFLASYSSFSLSFFLTVSLSPTTCLHPHTQYLLLPHTPTRFKHSSQFLSIHT
jgi:hypothetical protein